MEIRVFVCAICCFLLAACGGESHSSHNQAPYFVGQDIDTRAFNQRWADSSFRNANEVVRAFCGYPTTEEGSRISVTVTKGSMGLYNGEYVHTNMADDAMRDERIRLYFHQNLDGQWVIDSAKQMWRCWPMRGDTFWTTSSCL